MKENVLNIFLAFPLILSSGTSILHIFHENRSLQIWYFHHQSKIKRKGMQCKRTHIVPLASETILIDHMYKDSYGKMKNITKGLDDSLLEV